MWIFSGVCLHAFVNTCLPACECVCVCKLGHVSTRPQCRPAAAGLASWGNEKETHLLDSSSLMVCLPQAKIEQYRHGLRQPIKIQ